MLPPPDPGSDQNGYPLDLTPSLRLRLRADVWCQNTSGPMCFPWNSIPDLVPGSLAVIYVSDVLASGTKNKRNAGSMIVKIVQDRCRAPHVVDVAFINLC